MIKAFQPVIKHREHTTSEELHDVPEDIDIGVEGEDSIRRWIQLAPREEGRKVVAFPNKSVLVGVK